MPIEVVLGDITELKVDAIVNAANSALLGGGGVDGAIHDAAGPELLAACKQLRAGDYPDGLPTGEAVVTPGFRLPAQWVVHTVGPIYASDSAPAAQLAAAYRSSCEAALAVGAKSIAFPAISAGIFGYPKREAAEIAIATCREYEAKFERIVLCQFSQDAFNLYEGLLGHSS